MRSTTLISVLSTGLIIGACASMGGDEPPVGPPSIVRAAGAPVPPQGKFYADCIAASVAAGTYDREPGENLLRFTCKGPTARVFYDGLNARSVSKGSEYVADGRTWRFSETLIANPVGADGCSTDGVGDYACVVVLNIGEFLSAE